MISEKMLGWGSQGSVIRELADYGDRRAAIVGRENVFNFTIGGPSIPGPDCIHETIRELMDTLPFQQLHGYTPAPGLASVRQQIAGYLNTTYGSRFRAQDLFLTPGASAALAIVCAALLSPGDQVVTLTPYFPEYRVFVEAPGGVLVAVPSHPDTFQVDIAAVERAVNPKTAAVLLNSPNNPSGVVLSRESIGAIAALLEARAAEYGHPIYLIADEPYRELVYDGVEVPFIPTMYRDTVYCYSFSKSLSLPGERIGFLAVNPDAADDSAVMAAIFGAARALGYVNASTLFQLVVGRCIGQTADISRYEVNRNTIYNALTELGYQCLKPEGAFYLFLKTPGAPGEFFRRAKEMDLLMVPGEDFDCPGYLRLAYCVELEQLERSIPRFRALAEEFGLIR